MPKDKTFDVKMKTISAGPEGSFGIGKVKPCSTKAEAEALITGGFAERVTAKAAWPTSEKAVTGPEETRKALIAKVEAAKVEAAKVEARANMTVVEAINMLDPANAEHRTDDGKPKVTAIESILGRQISAADRDMAWEQISKSTD